MSMVGEKLGAGCNLMVVKIRQEAIGVRPLYVAQPSVIGRNMSELVRGENAPTL
jgi:hypothetical protein